MWMGRGHHPRCESGAGGDYPDLPIEVEVRDLDELREAVSIAAAHKAGRVPLEASGGVTLAHVRAIADTGVDYISVGAFIHSVKALDISMKVKAARSLPVDDAVRRIRAAKAQLGDRLVILGHHYQRDEIVALSDYRGDSLQLSREAAQSDVEYIVFCGVLFMAESAAILAKANQHVFIPDIEAGCYLAHTATRPLGEHVWATLNEALGDVAAEVTPITYVNSDAELKAFCGQHGGIACTSGNAEKVLRWALARRPRVFFFPDQHLGRNTALKMGIAPEEILLWHTRRPPNADVIRSVKIILWPGACNVHQCFTPSQVKAVRAQYPGIRVIVHPESKAPVVALVDNTGFTAYIIKQIAAAPPGTKWAKIALER